MKICVFLGFLLVSSVVSTPLKFDQLAPLLGADLQEIIPDEYIVVFEPLDRFSSEEVDSHMETIAEMMKEEEGSKMIHTYNIGDTFRGYSGKMSTRANKEKSKSQKIENGK